MAKTVTEQKLQIKKESNWRLKYQNLKLIDSAKNTPKRKKTTNQNDKNQKNFRQNSAKEIQTGYLH
jgi:hypothetical protein